MGAPDLPAAIVTLADLVNAATAILDARGYSSAQRNALKLIEEAGDLAGSMHDQLPAANVSGDIADVMLCGVSVGVLLNMGSDALAQSLAAATPSDPPPASVADVIALQDVQAAPVDVPGPRHASMAALTRAVADLATAANDGDGTDSVADRVARLLSAAARLAVICGFSTEEIVEALTRKTRKDVITPGADVLSKAITLLNNEGARLAEMETEAADAEQSEAEMAFGLAARRIRQRAEQLAGVRQSFRDGTAEFTPQVRDRAIMGGIESLVDDLHRLDSHVDRAETVEALSKLIERIRGQIRSVIEDEQSYDADTH
ncbi:MAG TPA: hypothetical protein VKA32_08735 [Gammaproteobacteria bacterium]|nr:hypothetical protein [Gammaproteobacteria bacterium]